MENSRPGAARHLTAAAQRLKDWARRIKRDVTAVALAARDPRVPWYVKALAVFIVAYALSPIDLIPDFIPVLGLLDDVILVPLGILLVVHLMPAGLMAEYQAQADAIGRLPKNRVAGAIVIGLWLIALAATAMWAWDIYAG